MLDRILCGVHGEERIERMRHAIDCHLTLGHTFEQCRLRFGGGTVDLVGDENRREDRAGLELEAARRIAQQAHSGDVGRHEVGGELDARRTGCLNAALSARTSSVLAVPGTPSISKMAAREEDDQRIVDPPA